MFGGALLEWSMLPADDDDLRAGVDVVDSAVVVPIVMPIVESSECVLLREILWHRLLFDLMIGGKSGIGGLRAE